MLRKVYLHGGLAAFHDGPIEIMANTIAEVVESITRQLPGFAPHPTRGRQRIKVVGCETVESLFTNLGNQAEIHIVHQLNGGKSGGLGQILIGAALIGLGIFTFGATTFWGSMLLKVGALSLLGGLSQLLAPTPENDTAKDQSRYLGSPKNTVAIGTRIPILYGEDRVYGQFLSFDINAREFRRGST
ncbi:tail assembly protein [Mesorhizobium sp. STM 4661]|uniref:tail assembly protein n=1 Tax=Mesorhizobium sp. STM 4661 TaxID=1297570 RepID=UPI0002BFC923|nr:tail assembly protein [Mesorhizobium sp. STM 4661]CCV12924.1 putative Tail assembly protein I [Mesorhizobium sp. STM 4661]